VTRALLLFLLIAPLAAACAHRRVDAVFIELEDPHMARIECSSVSSVVIANVVGYPDQNGKPYEPKFPAAVELIRKIPDDTAIYVGLVYVRNFKANEATKTYLEKAAVEDGQVAYDFLNYLAGQGVTRPIAGWYLAREIHNFDDSAREQQIKDYLKSAAKLPPGDVLFAPFFVTVCEGSKSLSAERTAAMFANLVRGTRITHLLLQDGFTGRFSHKCDWPSWDKYADEAERYEDAVAAAMKNENKKFWVDLELEGPEAGTDRIKRQYGIVPDGAPVVAYKFQDCRDKNVNAEKCPPKECPPRN
jgi:hypothetical protein